ncbi:MAG: hypothetical protein ABSC03_09765 [Verrucomicrobiota bacterium]|jgi:hypothetical protein
MRTSVLNGAIVLDAYHELTPDTALVRGHYYSDKAPGTVALAMPAFAACASLARVAGVDLDSKVGWLVTDWAACAFSQALPAALGAVALFVWLGRFVRQRVALVTVLALFLGGMPLPYCAMLFSHAQVVGLIGIAIWALKLFQGDGGQTTEDGISPRRMALAGFCLGLALASEYTAGIVVAALVGYVVVRHWSVWWPRGVSNGSAKPRLATNALASRPSPLGLPPLLWFFVAAIPPLLLIPAYSWATIGNPFILPYSLNESFPEMKRGLYAIQWPDAETAFKLLFGPTHGLFFWSPFLLLAGFGYAALFRRSVGAFWLMYAVPLLQVTVISGRVWDWQAGFCFGPRYLAPMLPLLALPCALGVQRWPKLGITLGIYSIAVVTLATLTDACADYSVYNPLTEQNIPKFLKGEFSHTLGTAVLGLPPFVSVALFYSILIGGIAWLWRLTGEPDKVEG